jgi:hypothetical protein
MSPVSDPTSDRPLVEQPPSKAPRSRSAPPDVEPLITEVAALAGLLAQVVELAGKAAIFPGHRETLAKQAMEHPSLRAALLARATGYVVSTPHSTVTSVSNINPCPPYDTAAGVRPDPSTASKAQARPCAGRKPAAVRLVLCGVVTLAKQAPELPDEQLRSRLAALGRLIR